MGFFARLRGTFIKDNGIQDEIKFHIEQRAEELIAEGQTRENASNQAHREFGNPSKWQEETHDTDMFVTLENWLRDTRQSLRGLRQRPVFTLTAIGSLAIGIGATVQSIRMLLIRKLAALSAFGFIAGIAVVTMTSNLLAHSFEGLPPIRMETVAVVCVAIALAAITAILSPLYRIARIDPSTALRHE